MLTIESLIKDADIIKEQTGQRKEFFPIKRLNDDIEIKSIDVERLLDLSSNCKNDYSRAKKICYEGISQPNIKDKELWKKYGVSISNPYEIVKKIFKLNEVLEIANKICDLSGLNEVPTEQELIEEIKN